MHCDSLVAAGSNASFTFCTFASHTITSSRTCLASSQWGHALWTCHAELFCLRIWSEWQPTMLSQTRRPSDLGSVASRSRVKSWRAWRKREESNFNWALICGTISGQPSPCIPKQCVLFGAFGAKARAPCLVSGLFHCCSLCAGWLQQLKVSITGNHPAKAGNKIAPET